MSLDQLIDSKVQDLMLIIVHTTNIQNVIKVTKILCRGAFKISNSFLLTSRAKLVLYMMIYNYI